MTTKPTPSPKYTCREYRLEMMLLGLENQLQDPGLDADQRQRLEAEAGRLRRQLDMD